MHDKWQKKLKFTSNICICTGKSLEEFTPICQKELGMVIGDFQFLLYVLLYYLISFFFNQKACINSDSKNKGEKNLVSLVHRNKLIHKNIML